MKIRDATPDDAAFLAWVKLIAARSHLTYGPWDYILDVPEDDTLAFLEQLSLSESVHWCHHSLFLVAEVDGERAGSLCAFDPEVHGGSALDAGVISAFQNSKIEADMGDGATRAAAVGSCMPDYAEGVWVVENVATRPEFRGRGIVHELLMAALDRGREQGFKRGQIAALIGNEKARRAYIRAGFEPDLEKRHPDFAAALSCPGIERLLRDL